MVGVAEMTEAVKAAEWAATMEAEAVRVTAGRAVSQRKVAWISNPAIRPLAPTATSVWNPTKSRNAQTALPLQRRRPLPTPNSQHGGVLGSVRTNLGVGLLVATSARPALAARHAPRERHEDEYWVADSDATENKTQGSSHLADYTPPPQETR